MASTELNKSGITDVRFEWQDEYGAFSFDAKRLPNYISYVERQKEHHTKGTLIPIPERTSSENVGPHLVREDTSSYAIEEDSWQEEMMSMLSEAAQR